MKKRTIIIAILIGLSITALVTRWALSKPMDSGCDSRDDSCAVGCP